MINHGLSFSAGGGYRRQKPDIAVLARTGFPAFSRKWPRTTILYNKQAAMPDAATHT
jgi:hypothetical protein